MVIKKCSIIDVIMRFKIIYEVKNEINKKD